MLHFLKILVTLTHGGATGNKAHGRSGSFRRNIFGYLAWWPRGAAAGATGSLGRLLPPEPQDEREKQAHHNGCGDGEKEGQTWPLDNNISWELAPRNALEEWPQNPEDEENDAQSKKHALHDKISSICFPA